REIAKRTAVGISWHLDTPAEHGMDASGQHGVIQHLIGPGPENAVSLPEQLEQFASPDWRLADALGASFSAHAGLDGPYARLDRFALGLVRLLCCSCRSGTSLLGEGEVGIARAVGVHHLGSTDSAAAMPSSCWAQSI